MPFPRELATKIFENFTFPHTVVWTFDLSGCVIVCNISSLFFNIELEAPPADIYTNSRISTTVSGEHSMWPINVCTSLVHYLLWLYHNKVRHTVSNGLGRSESSRRYAIEEEGMGWGVEWYLDATKHIASMSWDGNCLSIHECRHMEWGVGTAR